MTDERLQEMRKRLEGISEFPPPWRYADWSEQPACVLENVSGLILLSMVQTDLTSSQDDIVGPFVAHARQDVPDLLAEVERLRREVATLQGIISDQQQESGLYDAGWNAAITAASKDAYQRALNEGIDRLVAGVIRNSVILLKLRTGT